MKRLVLHCIFGIAQYTVDSISRRVFGWSFSLTVCHILTLHEITHTHYLSFSSFVFLANSWTDWDPIDVWTFTPRCNGCKFVNNTRSVRCFARINSDQTLLSAEVFAHVQISPQTGNNFTHTQECSTLRDSTNMILRLQISIRGNTLIFNSIACPRF